MKYPKLTLCCAVLLLAVVGNSLAVSEEPPKVDMAKVMKIITPGKMHKEFDYFIGTWDVECKLVMPGMPSGEPSKLVAKTTWLFEGRWTAEDMEGSFMGRPYRSYSISGYDNHTRNFVTTVVSNRDTMMNTFRGVQVDPKNQSFVLYGTINEYMDGTFNKPVRAVTKKIDADNFTRVIWDMQIGEDGAPVLSFKFKRRKE